MGFINLYMDPYSSTIIREFRPVACFKIFFRKWDEDPNAFDRLNETDGLWNHDRSQVWWSQNICDTYIQLYTYIHIYIVMCIYMFIAKMNICMHACMQTNRHTYTYIYTYIYIHKIYIIYYIHISTFMFLWTLELQHQVMSFGHSSCFEAQQHALRQLLGSQPPLVFTGKMSQNSGLYMFIYVMNGGLLYV